MDTGRTGGLGHTEVAPLGKLGKRTRRGAGGPAKEVEIMSQYQFDRKRRKKENEDFMRSLGIEMSVSASKRTAAENRRRRRTSSGVVSEGTARVGRTIRSRQLSRAMQIMRACFMGKGEVFREVVKVGKREGREKVGGGVNEMSEQWWGSLASVPGPLTLKGCVEVGGRWSVQRTPEAVRRGRGQGD